jgi:hypothetical protein
MFYISQELGCRTKIANVQLVSIRSASGLVSLWFMNKFKVILETQGNHSIIHELAYVDTTRTELSISRIDNVNK